MKLVLLACLVACGRSSTTPPQPPSPTEPARPSTVGEACIIDVGCGGGLECVVFPCVVAPCTSGSCQR